MKKSYKAKKLLQTLSITFFTELTHSLGLKKKTIGLENILSSIVKNVRNFECIKKIKASQEAAKNSLFSFNVIGEKEVKNVIKRLPINKCTFLVKIQTKIFKQYLQIYSNKLSDIFNESIEMEKFYDILKKAEVKSICKTCCILCFLCLLSA